MESKFNEEVFVKIELTKLLDLIKDHNELNRLRRAKPSELRGSKSNDNRYHISSLFDFVVD